MQKGFNSDVVFQGKSFHVQSEDWGYENPFLVSRIFLNGAIIKNIKTSYSEVLPPRSYKDASAIRQALHSQHQRLLDLLTSGQL